MAYYLAFPRHAQMSTCPAGRWLFRSSKVRTSSISASLGLGQLIAMCFFFQVFSLLGPLDPSVIAYYAWASVLKRLAGSGAIIG